MKKLSVKIEDIAEAMEMSLDESRHYLDLETGEVIVMPIELLDDEGFSGEDDEDEEFDDDEDADDPEEVPDWEKTLVPIAKAIMEDSPRYAPIPEPDSHEAYRDMERFAGTVTDKNLREKLDIALDGKGAFNRFRNVLYNYPEEKDRWFTYKSERMSERAREWLKSLEVEPVAKA